MAVVMYREVEAIESGPLGIPQDGGLSLVTENTVWLGFRSGRMGVGLAAVGPKRGTGVDRLGVEGFKFP